MTELQVQPEAAWRLTPADFWKLWDTKLRQFKRDNPSADRMTLKDLEELEQRILDHGQQ